MANKILKSIVDAALGTDKQTFTGWYGEILTEKELLWVKMFGRDGKILHNVYVPKEDGETTEMDVLYITRKGIFVFESKNYSGWIYGDERSMKWTAMMPNKTKYQFYNPIMQNRNHLKWLGKYLGEDVPLFSIIVFSERCELKKVNVTDPDIRVIKRDRTYATVRKIWESVPDALEPERLQEVYNKLSVFTKVDEEVKTIHVENIKAKFDVEEKPPHVENEKADESPKENKICPKCGSKLVLRKASKGTNAGGSFYGCSGFPKCRYIESIK